MESNTNVTFDGHIYLRKSEVWNKLKQVADSYPQGSLEREIWNDACQLVEDISPTWAHWIVYGRASSADTMWEKSRKCSNCQNDPSYSEVENFCSGCGKPMNGIVLEEPCEYYSKKLGCPMCKRTSEECHCNGDVDYFEIGRDWRASHRR